MFDIERLIQIDQRHLVHPLFHPSDHTDPMIWVEGHGAMIRGADGREFIDGLSGLWNVNVGHGRAELGEAAARQMTKLAYASAYTGTTNIPAIKLAEKLAERCYPSINHFSSPRAAPSRTTVRSRRHASFGTLKANRTS